MEVVQAAVALAVEIGLQVEETRAVGTHPEFRNLRRPILLRALAQGASPLLRRAPTLVPLAEEAAVSQVVEAARV